MAEQFDIRTRGDFGHAVQVQDVALDLDEGLRTELVVHGAAVTWKRATLKGGQHEYTDVKTERIERAIADDVAFLAAHPVRAS